MDTKLLTPSLERCHGKLLLSKLYYSCNVWITKNKNDQLHNWETSKEMGATPPLCRTVGRGGYEPCECRSALCRWASSPVRKPLHTGCHGRAGWRCRDQGLQPTGCATPPHTAQEALTKQWEPKESTPHSRSKLPFSLTSDLEVALNHKIKNISLERP